MEKINPVKFVPLALMVALLSFGCTREATQSASIAAKPPAAEMSTKQQNLLKGQIVGVSNKARTISISTGEGEAAETSMVRFDDLTKGMEFAKKGDAAIIAWEQRGEDKFATEVKPKLAQLPAGVTEIKVDEVHSLVTGNAQFTLVDARPASRYNEGHLPGAISVPVAKLKKLEAKALPDEKDKLLVFYCGGPT